MMPFFNSLFLASGTVGCSLILGVPLAIFLVKTDLPFKKWLKYIYLIPIFIPPSIIALSWISLLGSARWLYTPWGAIALLTLCYFPFVTLLSCGGISVVGRDLEEAARVDYSGLGILRHITLPYAFNYILAGGLFVFVFAVSNYEIPALLGINTFPVEIFAQFSGFYDYQKACLFSLPLVALTTAMIILAARLMQNRDYIAVGATWSNPWIIKLGRVAKGLALIFILLLLGTSTVLPFSVLAQRAGKFAVYLKAIKLSWPELNFSLFWALAGTILAVSLSFVIAYVLERSRGALKHTLYYLSILPFAIAPTVLGIILIKIFNRPTLDFIYSSPLILLAAYLLRFSPFAVRILSASIRHIDPDLENEAEICGAGLWRKLFLILAPLCRRGLIISFAIIFALILGELAMTILLVPAGMSTLALKIYTLMHYGSSRLVAALALILALLILLSIGVLLFISKNLKRAFLITMTLLLFLQAPYGGCLAQEKQIHLYSTWDVLEVDTLASAWLIKRFLDQEATFRFYPKGELIEEGIAFDTPDAEFRRKKDMCTFETILKKYKLKGPPLIKIGQMIHDIEINYWQQPNDKQTQLLNHNMDRIINQTKDPLDCCKKAFLLLDQVYRDNKEIKGE